MNNQAVSSLAEKGVTVEKATVYQKLNMNHRCLAAKKKSKYHLSLQNCSLQSTKPNLL